MCMFQGIAHKYLFTERSKHLRRESAHLPERRKCECNVCSARKRLVTLLQVRRSFSSWDRICG